MLLQLVLLLMRLLRQWSHLRLQRFDIQRQRVRLQFATSSGGQQECTTRVNAEQLEALATLDLGAQLRARRQHDLGTDARHGALP